jgi:hypothetical protein
MNGSIIIDDHFSLEEKEIVLDENSDLSNSSSIDEMLEQLETSDKIVENEHNEAFLNLDFLRVLFDVVKYCCGVIWSCFQPDEFDVISFKHMNVSSIPSFLTTLFRNRKKGQPNVYIFYKSDKVD